MADSVKSVLTVFLASTGPALGVRDVLRDLSTAGLVAPFVWVDDAGVTPGGARIPAVETACGADTTVVLQDVLASRRVDVVRLCVIVPGARGTDPVRVESERALADLLSSNSGGARLVRLRTVLRRPGDTPSDSVAVALAGWHNLLVAPEDSRGPGMGHESLTETTDPVDVGRHAAPVIAGIVGLWTDAEHAPFDEQPVLPGSTLRVVRSFYRRLDTSHAEHELRTHLLDFGGQLPLPRDAGTAVVYADDVPAATRTMAQALWVKHRHLLQGERVSAPPADAPRLVKFTDALTMFFSFLVAVLRNAPAQWAARVGHRASAAVASAAQSTLFGSAQGARRVVVRGVDADGRRVGWSEYEAASRQIGAALDGATNTPQSAAPDLSSLWRDYARAALTLADAAERSPGLPTIQVGAHRAVLRSASDIVPGPDDEFTDIPGVVSATLNVHAAEAPDLLGIRDFQARLRELEQDPTIGLDARRTSAALAGWVGRIRRSFAVTFGSILADGLSAGITEAGMLLERLNAAEAPRDLAEASADQQARMFRQVRIATLGFLAAAIVAGVLAWQELISWWTGGPVIAVCVLVWAGVVAWICQRTQQYLEQLLVEREAASAAAAADRRNLRSALREIENLTAAYRQFLSWNRALGAFLAKPLGVTDHTHAVGRSIEWGMPRHSAVGIGSPEPAQVERVADALRQDMFGVGWLTEAWDSVVGSAGSSLGAAGLDIDRDPTLLAAKAGAGSGSPLDEWSLRFHRGERQASGAALMWERALGELSGSRGDLARELLATIEHRADGAVRRYGIDEFLAGVGQPAAEGFFDPAVFTDTAAMRGLTTVAETVSTRTPAGCGLVAVTTQYTEGIAAEDLRTMPSDGHPAAPVDIPQVPDLELRPAEPTHDRADRPAPAPFAAPVADGINF
ncbi:MULTISPECIES: hypothetical protein [Rhodococcus]|uniref:hypothetical protein n=1 Tax=Rhodococcus TaxID=1827 RepID=UPI000C9A2ADA|nr:MULTISPECIES: hypothetical protein [Rhodococcus]PND52229.1 hypothetical protein CQZ88_09950 [Rhodococcus sp. ENV425]USC17290.1 magnesium transporter [Rhodococcus sp. 11-3]WKX00588.1 magnesium transporter [Rhodococcus aetherivorans]